MLGSTWSEAFQGGGQDGKEATLLKRPQEYVQYRSKEMDMDAGGGIVRDLVSPIWRTTWDAHGMDGMVGNLTDVSTGRVYGCSPLTFGAQILGVVSISNRGPSTACCRSWTSNRLRHVTRNIVERISVQVRIADGLVGRFTRARTLRDSEGEPGCRPRSRQSLPRIHQKLNIPASDSVN